MIILNTVTKDIDVVKGDSGSVRIGIDNYLFKDGDTLYFGIKKTLLDPIYIKSKVITTFSNGKADIILNSDDTNIVIGKYVYGLRLVRNDGNKDTLIKIGYADFNVIRGVINE